MLFLPALYYYLTSDDAQDAVENVFNASDWGTSAWAEDQDWAFGQAWEWYDKTATARGWDIESRQSAEVYLVDAYTDTGSALEFWDAVTRNFDQGPQDEYQSLPAPPGWTKLTMAFGQASKTVVTVEDARELGEPVVMLQSAYEKTKAELADKGASSWETARPWVAGAGVVVSLVALARVVK